MNDRSTFRFKVQTVQRILRETVAEKLTGVQYAAEQCAELTKELTDEVRDKLKGRPVGAR